MTATATSDMLIDAFGRIREEVAAVLDGVTSSHLTWRPDPDANTIAWLVWHLTRVQDDHVAGAFGAGQAWTEEGWADRFGLPFGPGEIGYGQDSRAVGRVEAGAELLGGYHEAVAARTIAQLGRLEESDLARVVDKRWDPPVTLAVRLVSVISDDLQHVGQAAFVRGLAERA